MSSLVLFLTVFLACAVEAIEALTIVLAAGTGRHWPSALQGTATAVVALALTVGALGPAIGLIPLAPLRLVVGALLLIFGLQWLRKAVLRGSGHKALHDESAAYLREVTAARAATAESRGRVRDWYAFTLSFKGVFLEGLEVAFIVVTFGNNQRDLPLAVLGAAAAVLVVTGAGIAVRAPLARVPENAVKFGVGTMLTSFGLFWATEGAGAHWPGSDAALLVLVPAVALAALGCTALLRRTPHHAAPAKAAAETTPVTSRVRKFFVFWYDFIVGDDWRVAAGVAVALAATATLVRDGVSAWWLMPPAVAMLFGISLRSATAPRGTRT